MRAKRIFKFINYFFSITGIIFFISLLILLFYGESSKQRRDLIFATLNSFMGIGPKYDGWVANTPSKYFRIIYYNIKNKFTKFPYHSLNIEIDLENLKKIEALRKNKFQGKIEEQRFVEARIDIFNDQNSKIKETVRVKLRPKGNRELHYLTLDSMSYKIDVRGKKKFILGMEEMSLQKPIVRNYSWEILFHDLLKSEDVLALDIVPVKLYRNGEYLGIFVLEEGFGKELLEKQSRKEGPIIGIDDDFRHNFPDIKYDYYSENYWLTKYQDIFFASKEILKNIKENYLKEDFYIFDYFDLEKWAKYFAMTDMLKMYHGSTPRSVKLYYNPSTGLIEPIAFDGHYSPGYKNFSLIDFIYDKNIIYDKKVACGYVCANKNWLALFFDEKNEIFLKEFIKYLKLYTSKDYEKKIDNLLNKKINQINDFFYSEYHSADRIFYKSPLPYYFDISPVFERNIILNKKIKFIESYLQGYYENKSFKNQKSNSLIVKSNNFKNKILNQLNGEKINFTKGIWLLENINLVDSEIILEEDAIIVLSGKNSFIGKNKKFIFSGPGMLVQKYGDINFVNVNFRGLKNVKIMGLNWTGAINLIYSNVDIKNVIIEDTLGEDSINIVNSNSNIENLSVINSFSDAIDIDFGNLVFDKINCKNSGNDCLDTSGAKVTGNYLTGKNVKDKLGSFGEYSSIFIKEIEGKRINIGIVSKDGSDLEVNNLILDDTNIYAASYEKKYFFNNSSLIVHNLNPDKIEKLLSKKILVSKNNRMIINNTVIKEYTKNKKILKKIYNDG